MVTKLIGIKEFRQNITSYHKLSLKNNWRFVILNRNEPIFEVTPVRPKNASLEQLIADVAEAREDYKKGRYYTSNQVRKNLGL